MHEFCVDLWTKQYVINLSPAHGWLSVCLCFCFSVLGLSTYNSVIFLNHSTVCVHSCTETSSCRQSGKNSSSACMTSSREQRQWCVSRRPTPTGCLTCFLNLQYMSLRFFTQSQVVSWMSRCGSECFKRWRETFVALTFPSANVKLRCCISFEGGGLSGEYSALIMKSKINKSVSSFTAFAYFVEISLAQPVSAGILQNSVLIISTR